VAEKRYYWLKLKRDFFKRHDVRIIEAMPNGKDYVLFYLKLLLESIDHEGALRFSETIPYNEDMLSVITNTNIDVVRAAMKLFVELKMIEVFDDSTIFMNEVQALIGSETKWAEKKRKLRSKEDNVLALSPVCPINVRQEIETDKEKETDKERECIKPPTAPSPKPVRHKYGEYSNVLLTDEELDKLKAEFPDWSARIERLSSYMASTGKSYKNHLATIRNWARKDAEQPKREERGGNVFLEMLNEERGL
jgi:predicted phage replisome organizer